MKLLEALNPQQREAVEHVEGPLLILAGAGSGKTRVITRRIAHMVIDRGVFSQQILAVTFTNKAAHEMRERVDELLLACDAPQKSEGLTISTFHSLGARLLRRHADRLGLTWSFGIYDDVDQKRLIRSMLKSNDESSAAADVRRIRGYIERMKNRGINPTRAHELAYNKEDEENAYFYEDYQRELRSANCLDFGDLILGVLELFRDDEELARAYSRQWRFVMVDEFQDTNPAQYELLRHLTCAHSNLAVVGDDDQAIYRWRGATVANILGFEGEFDKTKVIKLEQNYRSTQVILDAANDIIQHNPGRRDKRLWTAEEGGEKLTVYTAGDDRDEAQFIAERIRLLEHRGATWDDFAVFFRTNAQARLFEEQLRFAAVPYRIVGGTSFYHREEIKDLLAYLKIALNPVNQVDIMRVINVPSRSVGEATARKLQVGAQIPGIGTMFHAIRYVLGADVSLEGDVDPLEPSPQTFEQDEALLALETMKPRQIDGIREFYQVIEALRDELMHFESLSEVLRQFIERIGYFAYIDAKHQDVADDKKLNVAELINAIEEFERDWEDADDLPLQGDDAMEVSESMLSDSVAVRKLRAFIDQSALIQNVEESEVDELATGAVTLMTVHGSKGLEFETVFLAGMEDSLFPSIRDQGDLEELYEERRLAYVAITRARKKLYVTNAKRRRKYGQFKDTNPSRFLLEIDPDRITIDPKSNSKVLDWRVATRKKRRRELTDDELYFSDHGSGFEFDQSPDDAFAQPSYDEFAQVPAEEAAWGEPAPEPSVSGRESLEGKTVTHTRFGIGEVLATSGSGDKAVVTVSFPGKGSKKIMRRFLRVLG